MAEPEPGTSSDDQAVRRYASAGGAVVTNGRLLVLDRPERGEVRLPKGHIEPGEDPAETALRETAEESGYAALEIVADLGTIVNRFTSQSVAYERPETYFLMRLLKDEQIERPPKDQAQFRPLWLPFSEAIQQLTYESEREFARRAAAAAAERGLA